MVITILYFVIACIFYCSQSDKISENDSYEPSLLSIFAISWPLILLAIFINYLFKLFENEYKRIN